MTGRRTVLRAVGALLLAVSAGTLMRVEPATAAADEAGSAVTLQGRGDFAGLTVTVARTRDLTNQVVPVTWSGAAPTRGNFTVNYLQIFQCWGDVTSGPDREQCQYGGLTGDPRGGAQVASRQVTYSLVDPKESLRPERPGQLRFVPFRSVSGKTRESALSEFFDRSTTNEVPFGRTGRDGTGVVPFEVQTAVEAPGLGCGAPVSDTGTAGIAIGRPCFLVVVPRGSTEVDGSRRTDDSSNQLLSSPLSESNWQNRLVFPLSFAPLGQPCPLGRAERELTGQENAVEAVSSYQPVLCAGAGRPVYSLSQVPDAVARRQVVGDAPGLALTSRPVTGAPPSRPLLYAPFALTGVSIAFDIESQAAFSAPEAVKARNGQVLTDLRLTPRLVAKLLTQSYRLAAARGRPGLDRNPLDLTRDPEFLALNPAFAELRYAGIADLIVPAGLSDAAALVWQWILADRDARAFLAGTPDSAGAVVNPAYRGLGVQEGFPKADTACETFPAETSQPPLCTLDAHPYAADGHDAARAAARGDTLSRSFYDVTAVPPSYKKQPPQPSGGRALLALADTATAERFGLHSAALRNTAGEFVRPDGAGLLSGLAAMRRSPVADVLTGAPEVSRPGAYPLTQLTYAVTAPTALSRPAGRDYAELLRYVAGPGQVSGIRLGQLPPGYAPMPPALRQQTLAVAGRLDAAGTAAIPAGGSAQERPAADVAVDGDGSPPAPLPPAGGPVLMPPAAALQRAARATVGPVGLPPGGSTSGRPSRAVDVPGGVALAAGPVTPALQAGAGALAVPACLAVGGLAALFGSGLRRRPRRRAGATPR